MESSLSPFYIGGMEGTTGFGLPYQQQQQQMTAAWPYFPGRPMLAPPLCNFIANPSLSMYQSLANFNLQSNQLGAVLHQQHTAFLSSELGRARERIVQLEVCLVKAEKERELWRRTAMEYAAMALNEAMDAYLQQRMEPSIGSSSDAGDAASCTSHPLAAEERREGTGMELC